MTDQPSITCPKCGMTSYHPKDIEHRYCGNCHGFHDTMVAAVRHDQLVSLLRTLTPTMSQSMGMVYIDFGGDAEHANIFFDALTELVEE